MVGNVAELDQGRRRSVEVRVKLSPALADEFNSIAEGRGLLPATLAAVALGEYVERHRQQASISRMVAMDASKRMADYMSNPEAMGQSMAAALSNPGVIEVFSSMVAREGE